MSALSKVAVREGFEPSVQLPVRILSRDVVSATHPSHRNTSAIIQTKTALHKR